MNRPYKPLEFRKASFLMKGTKLWISVSIVSLWAASAALGIALDPEHPSVMLTAAIAANPPSAADALEQATVDDYQPPDNGGPGKTGGSGTRWQ